MRTEQLGSAYAILRQSETEDLLPRLRRIIAASRAKDKRFLTAALANGPDAVERYWAAIGLGNMADEVKQDTYMGTGPCPTGNELAAFVQKYLPGAKITFDEKARVPAWNFDNSRTVKEFGWKIQSVEEMVLDEINGTRQAAGLLRVGAS